MLTQEATEQLSGQDSAHLCPGAQPAVMITLL